MVDLDLKIVADKGSNRPGFGYVALIARPDLVASGQLQDYNDAFTKQRGQDEVVGIINRSTTVKDPVLVRKMVPAGINADGRVSVEDLLFKQQWYLSHGAMSQAADIERAVDHQFVDYAVARLGPYR